MKKIIGILGVAVMVATMFFSANSVNGSTADTSLASLISMNTANAEDSEEPPKCPAGSPDPKCPIWTVKLVVGFPTNTIECTTGGTYRCELVL